MTVSEMAAYVIQELLAAGFKIQRYDSITTNSIYLKLDSGVCNSIRISDHRGKKQYRYRYNLLSDRKGHRTHVNSGVERHYYSFKLVDEMIAAIKNYRTERVLLYGPDNYRDYMENKDFGQIVMSCSRYRKQVKHFGSNENKEEHQDKS